MDELCAPMENKLWSGANKLSESEQDEMIYMTNYMIQIITSV